MSHIKSLNLIIDELDEDILQKTSEKANTVERLDEIPDIGKGLLKEFWLRLDLTWNNFRHLLIYVLGLD